MNPDTARLRSSHLGQSIHPSWWLRLWAWLLTPLHKDL